jgi:hypothetical protein
MLFRFHKLCLAATLMGAAFAGPARAEDSVMTPGEGAPAASTEASSGEKKVEWGIGVRARSVRAPKGLLELFVERAPGGVSNIGLGVDLVRRRGNLELQLGFEYERIEPKEGVWIQRDTNVAVDEVDYILSPKHNNNKSLGWITAEFTFINHASITKNFAIRFGGGLGIGVVTGSLGRYDVFCSGATNANPEPGCVPPEFGGTASHSSGSPQIVQYNLPPVFPVVNAILGVQIRPLDKMTINLEGGLRTFPFFGVSGGYFF